MPCVSSAVAATADHDSTVASPASSTLTGPAGTSARSRAWAGSHGESLLPCAQTHEPASPGLREPPATSVATGGGSSDSPGSSLGTTDGVAEDGLPVAGGVDSTDGVGTTAVGDGTGDVAALVEQPASARAVTTTTATSHRSRDTSIIA
jgi:hypothetical protein